MPTSGCWKKKTACVLEVVQGKADAFIYDQMSTFKNWQRHPETTRPLLKPFQEESWAIGVRKGNTELLRQVNEFLKEFRTRGGFEELGDRHLRAKRSFQADGLSVLLLSVGLLRFFMAPPERAHRPAGRCEH